MTMEHEALTHQIIGCAMQVHQALGPGFLESVYEKALAHELTKQGLKAATQFPINVSYDGISVGDFIADFLIENLVIVELKAVRQIDPAHEAQLVNYLTATGLDIGLLINFGASSLQFKRKHRVYKSKRQDSQD